MKSIHYLILILLSLHIGCGRPDRGSFVIVILHDNDVHFQTHHWKTVREIRQRNVRKYGEGNVLLLSAGDIFYHHEKQLSVREKQRKAFAVINKMNLMGYDALTLGNHEFDYGHPEYFPPSLEGFDAFGDVYSAALREAEFPLLSANIDIGERDFAEFQPYVSFNINGIDIVILGLTDISYLDDNSINPACPLDTALQYSFLREEADLYIALSHMGEDLDFQLAEKADFDIIIGGHTHQRVNEVHNDVHIVHAMSYHRVLGEIKIAFRDFQKVNISTRFIDLKTGGYEDSFRTKWRRWVEDRRSRLGDLFSRRVREKPGPAEGDLP